MLASLTVLEGIPYFCVSANLTKRKAHVHDSGPLWQACRASASLPLLIPPTVLAGPDGGILMDGGLMNNLVRMIVCDLCFLA